MDLKGRIEDLYQISIQRFEPLRVNHQGRNENRFFEFNDARGKLFIYKEIPGKSFHKDLETVFAQLARVNPGRPPNSPL